MLEFDSAAPCLCCNNQVLVPSKLWGPYSVALCSYCYSSMTLPLIRVIFLLRCQIATLQQKVAETESQVTRLFSAQQELEAELNEG